ncbi:MAG: hypothetical protein MI976_22030 [Pseudomonadales bacterium]|nr:hypothetical protein [Pseudomonadales bacterium]
MEIVWGLGLLVLLFAFLSILGQRRNASRKMLQKNGLESVLLLKALIALIQQHRGISFGIKNGDTTLCSQLTSVQSQINDAKHQLIANTRVLLSMERWIHCASHWDKLQKNWQELTANDALLQHNCLIRNLLYLLEDVAAVHQLFDEALPHKPKVALLWKDLLQIGECIGQARAMGTGIAAAKTCSGVAKIRMMFLVERIKRTADISLPQVCALLGDSGEASLADIDTRLKGFLCSVEEHLLGTHAPSISAQDYFLSATQILDEVFKLFDSAVLELKQSIQNPQGTNKGITGASFVPEVPGSL